MCDSCVCYVIILGGRVCISDLVFFGAVSFTVWMIVVYLVILWVGWLVLYRCF